jgi:hypothetical protein
VSSPINLNGMHCWERRAYGDYYLARFRRLQIILIKTTCVLMQINVAARSVLRILPCLSLSFLIPATTGCHHDQLHGYSLLTIFLVGLAAVFAVSELGWQIGMRNEGRGGANGSTLESAMLGLLALTIGFTFAMALSRFEARREAVLPMNRHRQHRWACLKGVLIVDIRRVSPT